MTIRIFIRTLALSVPCSLLLACSQPPGSCVQPAGVTLQVLGSGGPIADDGRASSAYLVWVDGTARVMIDAGGGSFLRFGEAGARFEDLDFIGLSHLHTDHSAGLPALLKSGNFSDRDRPLPIAGPDGDGVFPGVDGFLTSVLDQDSGAYAYLSGFLDGSGNTPMLTTLEVAAGDAVSIWSGDNVAVDAMRHSHAIDREIVAGPDRHGLTSRHFERRQHRCATCAIQKPGQVGVGTTVLVEHRRKKVINPGKDAITVRSGDGQRAIPVREIAGF